MVVVVVVVTVIFVVDAFHISCADPKSKKERVFLLFWFIYVNSNKRDKWFRPPLALDN